MQIELRVLIATTVIALGWTWGFLGYFVYQHGLRVPYIAAFTLLTPITWLIASRARRDWNS